MLCFVSPAKTMSFDRRDLPAKLTTTSLQFPSKTDQIRKIMSHLTKGDMQKLWSVSDKIADKSYGWLESWGDLDQAPAIYAYQGDTYKGLEAETLSPDDLAAAQKQLRILSGFYGLLRPFDTIKAYRLEMKTALPMPNDETLAQYWQQDIAQALQEDIDATQAEAVINLASQEYAKAVDASKLSVPVITCDFKENRDGQLKTIGIYAKRARGMMARYIIEQQPKTPSDLHAFDAGDYTFQPDLSDDTTIIFAR